MSDDALHEQYYELELRLGNVREQRDALREALERWVSALDPFNEWVELHAIDNAKRVLSDSPQLSHCHYGWMGLKTHIVWQEPPKEGDEHLYVEVFVKEAPQ